MTSSAYTCLPCVQFLSSGNDYAARQVCPCIWITSPRETEKILEHVLNLKLSIRTGAGAGAGAAAGAGIITDAAVQASPVSEGVEAVPGSGSGGASAGGGAGAEGGPIPKASHINLRMDMEESAPAVFLSPTPKTKPASINPTEGGHVDNATKPKAKKINVYTGCEEDD